MCPINQCSIFVNRCLAFITASMTIREEKLDDRYVDRSTDVLKIISEAHFFGDVGAEKATRGGE
jgi:hypothetical protein